MSTGFQDKVAKEMRETNANYPGLSEKLRGSVIMFDPEHQSVVIRGLSREKLHDSEVRAWAFANDVKLLDEPKP